MKNAGELTGSNFCIFVDEDSNAVYEIFCKWIRSVSKSAEDEVLKEAKKTGNERGKPRKASAESCCNQYQVSEQFYATEEN